MSMPKNITNLYPRGDVQSISLAAVLYIIAVYYHYHYLPLGHTYHNHISWLAFGIDHKDLVLLCILSNPLRYGAAFTI